MFKFESCTAYIPAENSTMWKSLGILKGSGIVARQIDDGEMMKVYFEGNAYNACNLNTLEEKIICAAGRLMTNYPTIAFVVVNATDLLEHFVKIGSVELIEKRMRVSIAPEISAVHW